MSNQAFAVEGAFKISAEREEQLMKHDFSIQHDLDTYEQGDLARLAMALVVPGAGVTEAFQHCPVSNFDPVKWGKMIKKSYPERVIIAGALLAAEYDREMAVKVLANLNTQP